MGNSPKSKNYFSGARRLPRKYSPDNAHTFSRDSNGVGGWGGERKGWWRNSTKHFGDTIIHPTHPPTLRSLRRRIRYTRCLHNVVTYFNGIRNTITQLEINGILYRYKYFLKGKRLNDSN